MTKHMQYAPTTELSGGRMPTVLLMQKYIWLFTVANAKTTTT